MLKLLQINFLLFTLAGSIPGQELLWTRNSQQAGGFYGWVTTTLGDVNRDGLDDILVSEMAYSSVQMDHNGRIEVLSGADGSSLYIYEGTQNLEFLGWAGAAAGDANNDGYADFAFSSAYTETVYFHSGRDGSLLTSLIGNPNSFFGSKMRNVGDWNHDGFDEIAIAAENDDTQAPDAGAVYVHSSKDGALVHAFFGQNSNDRFGYDVSGGRDVDADGTPDLIVANGEANAGSVFVYSGATFSLILSIPLPAERTACELIGDQNNDGHADILLGLEEFNDWRGKVEIWSGAQATLLSQYDTRFPDSFFGSSVRRAGDVDGGGIEDFIVGTRWGDYNSTEYHAGTATIFSGEDGAILWTDYGSQSFSFYGMGLSGEGDLNGDGFADVVMGATGDGLVNPHRGYIRVWSELQTIPRLQSSLLQVGTVGTLSLSGAAPYARIDFYGTLFGFGLIHPGPPGPGARLSLHHPEFLFATARADGQGVVTISTAVPSKLSGETVYMQTVQHASGQTPQASTAIRVDVL